MLLLFVNGEEVKRIIGSQSKNRCMRASASTFVKKKTIKIAFNNEDYHD